MQNTEDRDNKTPEIEVEEQGNTPIAVPFDPNKIKIRRDPFTLGELIDKIEHDEVVFDTSFQRKSDLWNAIQQSRLIESILLRLPLPAFYFDEIIEKEEDAFQRRVLWQVIDGLQRCSVIRNFVVDNKLQLTDLEFLTQFNGLRYKDLPRDLVRRINQTPLTVYVIEKGTPDDVKFNIFKRINTGGLILTPQEIRHAMNQGVPAQFVAELAEMDSFKEATCNKIEKERMSDRDFTTRFVSFYLQDYKNYTPDLDEFMNKGMRMLKTVSEEERCSIKENFDKAMLLARSIFGDDAFRKRFNTTEKRRPINKALFEVLSVLFAKMTDSQRLALSDGAELFKNKFIELNNDDKFLYSISSGTGQKESVQKRFTEMTRIINETIL